MITVHTKEAASFSMALRHVTLFRTQPIRFAFRAPTGKQVPIRQKSASPFHTLLFGQRGHFRVHQNDRAFPLAPHSLLLIKANLPFAITSEEHANASLLAVEFETRPENFRFDITKNGFFFLENAKVLAHVFEELQSLSDHRYAYGEALLLTLLEHLCRAGREKDHPQTLYRHALAYIRRHDADPPTSALIAFGTHYSPDHLSRLLKVSHGLSLSALIKRERLEILKNYLRFTSYTVERIAKILAFSSSAAMLAFFKYHTDMTPNEYRKHIRQNELKKP